MGGDCRIRTAQPVKVIEIKSLDSKAESANPLLTTYGKPPYEKNPAAQLADLPTSKGYTINFKTEKGKTYTLVPVNK